MMWSLVVLWYAMHAPLHAEPVPIPCEAPLCRRAERVDWHAFDTALAPPMVTFYNGNGNATGSLAGTASRLWGPRPEDGGIKAVYVREGTTVIFVPRCPKALLRTFRSNGSPP